LTQTNKASASHVTANHSYSTEPAANHGTSSSTLANQSRPVPHAVTKHSQYVAYIAVKLIFHDIALIY